MIMMPEGIDHQETMNGDLLIDESMNTTLGLNRESSMLRQLLDQQVENTIPRHMSSLSISKKATAVPKVTLSHNLKTILKRICPNVDKSTGTGNGRSPRKIKQEPEERKRKWGMDRYNRANSEHVNTRKSFRGLESVRNGVDGRSQGMVNCPSHNNNINPVNIPPSGVSFTHYLAQSSLLELLENGQQNYHTYQENGVRENGAQMEVGCTSTTVTANPGMHHHPNRGGIRESKPNGTTFEEPDFGQYYQNVMDVISKFEQHQNPSENQPVQNALEELSSDSVMDWEKNERANMFDDIDVFEEAMIGDQLIRDNVVFPETSSNYLSLNDQQLGPLNSDIQAMKNNYGFNQ